MTLKLRTLAILLLSALITANAFAAGSNPQTAKGVDVKPFYDSNFIFETIPGYPSCHASTIEELPDGTLVTAWYAGANEKADDVAIFGSRLPKGAKEWTKPEIIQKTEGKSQGNPVLFLDPGGKLWLFYMTMYGHSWNSCYMYYRTSTDGGLTWSAETKLLKDKTWMTKNKPIILKNGDWILPIYNEMTFQPAFLLTKDAGKTWKMEGRNLQVPGGAIQPTLYQRSNGDILAMFRTGSTAKRIWRATSTNFGASWSAPEQIDLPNPNAGIDIVDAGGGHVALAFNDSPNDRTPLSLALSLDEGRTWAFKRKIETTFGEYSYPAIFRTRDGLFHITYTWKRERIKHVVVNEAWIREGAPIPNADKK